MDNIKNDKYYANKIMTDVQYLIGLTEEYSYEEIQANETVLDSIFFRFIQIAENVTKMSKELKTRENSTDWGAISGLRNRNSTRLWTYGFRYYFVYVERGYSRIEKGNGKIY